MSEVLQEDGTDRAELMEMLLTRLGADWPAIAREVASHVRRSGLLEWQEVLLAICAEQFDKSSASILEVGTDAGYSAAIIRLAAPAARVTTLEPDKLKRRQARINLKGMGIDVRPQMSAVYMEEASAANRKYNMIFIDADHKHAIADLPWYNYLRQDGFILWHDYSPHGPHACVPVFAALNAFTNTLEHEPSIKVIDDTGAGMAGWYKRRGEVFSV